MDTLYYKYVKMELEEFAMFQENFPVADEEVQFNTESQFSYDENQRVLCNKLILTITKKEIVILKSVLNSFFLFTEDSINQLLKSDNIIEFYPQLLVQFASLNYGSLRGVLFTKTQGTVMSDYILPPLFFSRVITRSFEIKI